MKEVIKYIQEYHADVTAEGEIFKMFNNHQPQITYKLYKALIQNYNNNESGKSYNDVGPIIKAIAGEQRRVATMFELVINAIHWE
jgi:hypothetical protein